MTTPTLTGIPAELMYQIFDHLSQSDLQGLARVHRLVKDTAIRRLYEDVTFDLRRPAMFRSLARGRNRGLRHTRSLNVIPVHYQIPVQRIAISAISLIISCIEENKLKHLFLPESLTLDATFLLLLAMRQKRIEHLDCGPFYESMAMTLDSPLCSADWMSSLVRLGLPECVGDLQDLDAYGRLIQRARSLKSLDMRTHMCHAPVQPPFPLQDHGGMPGFIFRSLFGFALYPQLVLDSISFRNTELEHARSSYPRRIDFLKLLSLEINDCDGVAMFLVHLASILVASDEGGLLEIFECQVDDRLATPQQECLLGILAESRFLRHLTLGYKAEVNEMGYRDALFERNTELEVLEINVLERDANGIVLPHKSLPWPPYMLDGLSTRLSFLTQLAMSFPDFTLGTTSADYNDFRTAHAEYSRYINAVSDIRLLRALRIINWPHMPHQFFAGGPAPNRARILFQNYLICLNHLVQVLLRRMHERRTPANLKALSIFQFGDFVKGLGAFADQGPGYIPMRHMCWIPFLFRNSLGQVFPSYSLKLEMDMRTMEREWAIIHYPR